MYGVRAPPAQACGPSRAGIVRGRILRTCSCDCAPSAPHQSVGVQHPSSPCSLLSGRSHQPNPPSKRVRGAAWSWAKGQVIMDHLKCLMCLLVFPSFLLNEEPLLNTKTSEYLGNIKVLLLALTASFLKLFKNYLPSSASID